MINKAVLSREFIGLSKTWFHGTTSDHFGSLRNGVNIDLCGEYTDFGKGFYLTTDFSQASIHAVKRAKFSGDPIVFQYELDISRLKRSFNGQVWHKMNTDWAEFIYHNRSQKSHQKHNFDYVYVGVADGDLFNLVYAVDQGASIKDFHIGIAKYLTYDQLSIHHQDIITYGIIKQVKVVRAHERQHEYDDKTAVSSYTRK